MLPVVLSKDLNLAPKVIVRAPHKLILTLLFVLLYVLSKYPCSALVVTLHDLEQASLVMRLQVLEHYHRGALMVWADYLAEGTVLAMQLHVFTTKHCTTAILEKAFAFVGAIYDLLWAFIPQVFVHFASLNCLPAVIAASELCLGTVICDVLIHLVQDEASATVKQAVNLAERALIMHMGLQVFTQDLPTALRVWTFNWCVLTNLQMPLLVAALDLFVALGIGALNAELHHEAPDGDVRLEGTDDAHIAERATPRILDARLAEEVVAAGCLHRVLVDIEADWADPAIVGEARS